VLLDTNALFLPVRVGFPLDPEVDRHRGGAVVAVPASALQELDLLVARRTPGARAARALAEKYRVEPTRGRGDDAIVRAAVRLGAWVVTADRGLRDRLTAAGVTVLSPRDRHRLELSPGARPPPPRGVRRSPATVMKRAGLERSRRGPRAHA
jgi:uncharacterized protein